MIEASGVDLGAARVELFHGGGTVVDLVVCAGAILGIRLVMI